MGTCASRPSEEWPREGQLYAVSSRIFSNDGRGSGSTAWSVYTQQGRKGINQDSMILWEDFGGGGGGILCGVFDGHGPQGHLVSRKVRDVLPLKFLSFLPLPGNFRQYESTGGCLRWMRGTPPTPSVGEVEEPPLSAWKDAFVSSYKAMDKELRSHPTIDCFCSGTTAITLLKLGKNLFLGNIGDSRAVLGSKDTTGDSMTPVQLTVDLKPDLPKEAERITRCKGRVFALEDEPEVQRVWLPFDNAPGLAMARAFGDFCLKEYGVISVPEFSHWTLTEKDRFVVLASDGIWDVLSNQEVVDIVSSSPTRSSAAKFLVDAATREWKQKYPTSRMDDCAVVCLFLDGKTDAESEPTEICNDPANSCSSCEPCMTKEPSLERNNTVRSTVKDYRGTATHAGIEEHRAHTSAEDESWSGLEGVTRVNSLVQLPRFPGEKVTTA